MTPEEARTILSAYRSNGADADDPVFAEALAFCAADQELAEWFESQQKLDRLMVDAFAGVKTQRLSVPPVSPDAIVLGQSRPTRPGRRAALWTTMAASVALFVGFFMWRQGQRLSIKELTARIVPITHTHSQSFGTDPNEIDSMRNWFASQGAPSNFTMPAGLVLGGGVACEVLDVKGTKVSLLCLARHGADRAHLFVMDRSRVELGSGITEVPQFSQEDSVAMAVWVDPQHLYVLAGVGDETLLQSLLAFLPDSRASVELLARITSIRSSETARDR